MVSNQAKRMIWILWAVIWPASVFAILMYVPIVPHPSYVTFFLMAVMMVVISISYFQVNGIDIFIIQGVSMTAFLLFGLAVEMVLVQIGVLAYLVSLRLTKDYYYRYPLNMVMFLFISVTSAGFFYLIGGHNGQLQANASPQILQIVGYGLMAFLSNHIAFYLVSKAFFDDATFFGKFIIWEFVTTLLTMPISFIFYILYSEFGVSSILMVAIPLMTLSVIFRLVSRVSALNNQLKETSEIGRELSQKLDLKALYKHFLLSLHMVLKVDVVYLFELGDSGEVKAVRQFNQDGEEVKIKQDFLPQADPSLFKNDHFIASTKKAWSPFMVSLLPENMHSVMLKSFNLDEDEKWAVLLANKVKHSYGKQNHMIFEIMTHFFRIAVKNAANYEKTKMESERDPLTNLYNYRYFSNVLQNAFNDQNGMPFSIIMLDLDYFKTINDKYGHENGNKVLRQVASRLSVAVGSQDTVARYGGEEFIILLNNSSRKDAYQIAENLLMIISNEPYNLDEFSDHERPKKIQVTASLGVSTAPEQGEDAVTLIRNADRAMYTGAKQKGRNRVAVYFN